jgi:hypothetical protein
MPWVRKERVSMRPESPRETRLNRKIGLIPVEILAALQAAEVDGGFLTQGIGLRPHP